MKGAKIMKSALTHQGYSAGHPWYFHLGGAAPPPKAIRAAVRMAGYRGYREADIAEADALSEPSSTRRLDAIRQEVLGCAP